MADKEFKIELDYYQGYVKGVDGLLLEEGMSPDSLNVEFYLGTVRRARGYYEFEDSTDVAGDSNKIDGYVMHIDKFLQNDGTENLIMFADSKMYQYDSVNSQWDEVVEATSSASFSGTAKRFLDSVVYNTPTKNYLLFCDGDNNDVSHMGGDLAAKKWEIIATNYRAHAINTFYTYVLLLNTVESSSAHPKRIRWSDTADPTTWTGGNTGYIDIEDTPGEVMGSATLIDRMIIYKSDSIWELTYVGAPSFFQIYPLNKDIGLLSRKGLISVGNIHYFVTDRGFYRYDGEEFENISAQIHHEVFGYNRAVSRASMNLTRATYIPGLREIWFAMAVTEGADPHRIYRFNIDTESWWRLDIEEEVMCFEVYFGDTKAWQELTGTWNDLSTSWENLGAAQDFPLFGSYDGSNGTVKQIALDKVTQDGSYPTAYWCTPDYSFGAQTRYTEFWVEAFGSETIEVQWSDNSGQSWTSMGTRTHVSTKLQWYKFFMNKTREVMRFKIIFSDSNMKIRKRVIAYRLRVQ